MCECASPRTESEAAERIDKLGNISRNDIVLNNFPMARQRVWPFSRIGERGHGEDCNTSSQKLETLL